MNGLALRHLVWKEYRAIRGFWIALVGLALALYWLVMSVYGQATQMQVIFNIALATPAFFALGCAGTAWAIEREDETYGWLQAVPARERDVFLSKFGLCVVATLGMYAVLWLAAVWLMNYRTPEPTTLRDMCGLWLVAAVEALAWGTLFSLRMTRPLPAILAALFVTSSLTHVLAFFSANVERYETPFSDYRHAMPYRLAVAAIVLAVGFVLGMRWLHGQGDGATGSGRLRGHRRLLKNMIYEASIATPGRLTPSVSRAASLGHLFWQQWRQSSRMMWLIPLGSLFLITLALSSRSEDVLGWCMLLVLTATALTGAQVFLPDQERQSFRFFQEHNVPPRYVWLSRQLPWMVTLLCASIIAIVLSSLFFGREIGYAVHEFTDANQTFSISHPSPLATLLLLPSWVMVAYASGQLCSMLIRSGLLAFVAGGVLAAVLGAWVFIVLYMMRLSWWLAVAPIPLVLLVATWLRAPDWIYENKTRWARGKIIAATVLPAIAMVNAVAVFRVQQVPVIAWNHRPEADWTLTQAARDRFDLYRVANERFEIPEARTNAAWDFDAAQIDQQSRVPSEFDRAWLASNADTLAMLGQIQPGPIEFLYNPFGSDPPPIHNSFRLPKLLIYQGRELESQGKLAEALRMYRLAMQAAVELGPAFPQYRWMIFSHLRLVFEEIAAWGAHEKMTPELVRDAIRELEAFSPDKLPMARTLESRYLFAGRAIDGNEFALMEHSFQLSPSGIHLWRELPWEAARARRMLNQLAHAGTQRLALVEGGLEHQRGVVEYLLPPYVRTEFFFQTSDYQFTREAFNLARMYETTYLVPADTGYDAEWMVRGLVEGEARRRATLLTLALQQHRRDHGKLPPSLDELKQDFFAELPRDPFSGQPFVYFPDGPPPHDDNIDDQREAWEAAMEEQKLELTTPYLWSTSSRLAPDNVGTYKDRSHGPWGSEVLTGYAAWRLGVWYKIP